MNILIIGESGEGKSTSLRNVNWNESFLIKSIEKPLPFKNNLVKHKKGDEKLGNYIIINSVTDLMGSINSLISKYPHIKNIFIDDFQYYLSKPFVKGMSNLPKGTKIYDMMTIIQTDVAMFLFALTEFEQQNPNINIVILTHADTTSDGFIKMKTLGRLLDEKMSIEGLFTIVLRSKKTVIENKLSYVFVTEEAYSIVKNSMGMFDSPEIPNDINLVLEAVNKYYNN